MKGGATTFHAMDMEREYNVYPKIGRVLLFQHSFLIHSGADVESGTKLTLRTDIMFKKSKEPATKTIDNPKKERSYFWSKTLR